MKKIILSLFTIACLTACNSNKANPEATDPAAKSDTNNYFEFSVDGKNFTVNQQDVLTTYNEFGSIKEFKIFAGKEGEPSLTLTIPNDMSKASSTPSGSSEAGNNISQGSVSLQGYPQKADVFNNFDFMANPPLQPVADAIVITNSEKIGEEGRRITGTINTKTVADASSAGKQYTITGKFKVEHKFNGLKF